MGSSKNIQTDAIYTPNKDELMPPFTFRFLATLSIALLSGIGCQNDAPPTCPSDCPSGSTCDERTGECAVACNGDDDCACNDDDECDNDNPCDGSESCVSNVCEAGIAVECEASSSSCFDNVCNPSSGACEVNPSGSCACQNDNDCPADGDPCTLSLTCVNDQCASAGTNDCDDGNPCTLGTCSPEDGSCSYSDVDDFVRCTPGDFCRGGRCMAEQTSTPEILEGNCGGGVTPDVRIGAAAYLNGHFLLGVNVKRDISGCTSGYTRAHVFDMASATDLTSIGFTAGRINTYGSGFFGGEVDTTTPGETDAMLGMIGSAGDTVDFSGTDFHDEMPSSIGSIRSIDSWADTLAAADADVTYWWGGNTVDAADAVLAVCTDNCAGIPPSCTYSCLAGDLIVLSSNTLVGLAVATSGGVSKSFDGALGVTQVTGGGPPDGFKVISPNTSNQTFVGGISKDVLEFGGSTTDYAVPQGLLPVSSSRAFTYGNRGHLQQCDRNTAAGDLWVCRDVALPMGGAGQPPTQIDFLIRDMTVFDGDVFLLGYGGVDCSTGVLCVATNEMYVLPAGSDAQVSANWLHFNLEGGRAADTPGTSVSKIVVGPDDIYAVGLDHPGFLGDLPLRLRIWHFGVL